MEQEREKNDFQEKYYGSGFRNDSIVDKATGEEKKLDLPFYTLQMKKDMVKDLATNRDGMLHFSIHKKKNIEQGKPNCHIIYNKNYATEGKFLDLYSIKDFSVKKEDLLKMPTNQYGDICLLINTRGEIYQNNKALGLNDQESTKIEGVAFEVNNVRRQKLLDLKNGKEMDNSIKFVGAAFLFAPEQKEGTKEKQPFYTIQLDKSAIMDIPTDNNGLIHIDIRERKEQKKGLPTHSVVASPNYYNGWLDPSVSKEIKISKNDLLNPKATLSKEYTTKNGETKTAETIALTLSSDNKVSFSSKLYKETAPIPLQATAIDIDKEKRIQKIEERKEKKNLMKF